MLVLPERVFEKTLFVVLFTVCICGFIVVVAVALTVGVNDVVMVVVACLLTFTVCGDTAPLFIAGHLFVIIYDCVWIVGLIKSQ